MADQYTYQQYADILRKKYGNVFGEEEDDKEVVKQFMDMYPDEPWDSKITDLNEVYNLDPQGDAYPRAGYLKQAGYNLANIVTSIPQMVAAETAEEVQKGANEEVDFYLDPKTGEKRIPGAALPYIKAPEDKDETWGEWFGRVGQNIGRASNAYSPNMHPAVALQQTMKKTLQQQGLSRPEAAKEAILETERLREWKRDYMNNMVDQDPELQGMLLWNKEHPISWDELIEGNTGDVVMRGLAEAAPSLGLFLGANMVGGPPAAMATAFGLGKAGSYDQTMSTLVDEMGIPAEEALGYANEISTIIGAGEMILESVGGFQISSALGKNKVSKEMYDTAVRRYLFNKIGNPAIRKKLQSETAYTLLDVIKSGGKEFLTETYQEQNSFLGNEAAKQGFGKGDPDSALKDVSKQYGEYLTSRERQKEVYRESGAEHAGLTGLFAGGGTSSLGLGPAAYEDYQYWKKQRQAPPEKSAEQRFKEKSIFTKYGPTTQDAEIEGETAPTGENVPALVDERKQLPPGGVKGDDALMLRMIVNPASITEDEEERASYLDKVYKLRSNDKNALVKISDILDRKAKSGILEEAGLTVDDVNAGMNSEFPSDNAAIDNHKKIIGDKLLKYDAGVLPQTPGDQQASEPVTGLSLEVLDEIAERNEEDKPDTGKQKDDVDALFGQKDIETYEEPDVTDVDFDPDLAFSGIEEDALDQFDPEPDEEVLKFVSDPENYKAPNIDQKPTVPADEQTNPKEDEDDDDGDDGPPPAPGGAGQVLTPPKEKYTGVTKIISGGQIGADQAGLELGQELEIETGGTAPPGWATSTGPNQELLESFGLEQGEDDPKVYRKRTIKNVEDADGTVIFGKTSSPGSHLTIMSAQRAHKPYIENPTSEELKTWMEENNVNTLNVAGNREIDKDEVKNVLRGALKTEDTPPITPDVRDHGMSFTMLGSQNIWGEKTSTIDEVESGRRTATTRRKALGGVGDIVTFEGRPQQYEITGVHLITEEDLNDPVFIKEWSDREGWTEDHFKTVSKNWAKEGYHQTSFKKVGEPTPVTTPVATPVAGDIVEYKGKEWLLRGINNSGFAQLTDMEGKKFSGTPRPDKLTLVRKGETEDITDPSQIEEEGIQITGVDLSSIQKKDNKEIVEDAKSEGLVTEEYGDKGDVINVKSAFEVTDFRALDRGENPIQWTQKEWPNGRKENRLTAYYGDEGTDYTYSGLPNAPLPWTPELLRLKNQVEKMTGIKFNSALLNKYEGGKHSLGWHQDDELELGDNPVIASVSFGAESEFNLQSIDNPSDITKIKLGNGDLLVMQGDVQNEYLHSISLAHPKFKGKERINITFRRTSMEGSSDYEKFKSPLVVKSPSAVVKTPRPQLSIIDARTTPLEFTGDQVRALTYLSKITTHKQKATKAEDAEPGRLGIVSGYAGTGKTTIIENVAKDIRNNTRKTVHITAPTNKAVIRLEEVVDPNREEFASFATIHKTIYSVDEETGLFSPNPKLGPTDAVIVDESSMISGSMWNDLNKMIIQRGAELILFGDGLQLPPVLSKGDFDPRLLDKAVVEMTEVRRQALESEILSYATFLRRLALGEIPALDFRTIRYPDSSSGDMTVTNDAMGMYLYSLQNKEDKDSVFITATNPYRLTVNQKSRVAKYGKEALKEPLLPDEKLIFIANGLHSKNSQTTTLEKVPDLRPIKLVVFDTKLKKPVEVEAFWFDNEGMRAQFGGDEGSILVPAWSNAAMYHHNVMDGPKKVMGMTKKGKPLLKKEINVMTYAYGITAHKSQGSQWDRVFVNQNFEFGENPVRWLYTAVTRAQKSLVLHDDSLHENLTWNGIHQISKGPQKKTVSGMPSKKDIDERLQRIATGEKIEKDYQLFRSIENKLGKAYPFVTVQKLQQVFDKNGDEVAGKAIGTGIQVSMTKGDVGTMAHEYAEVYVDLLEDDKYISDALNRLNKNDRNKAKHMLSSHIDQFYTGAMKDKSRFRKMKLFLRRFWLKVKSLFKQLQDQELYDLIANRFFSGEGANMAQKRASEKDAGPTEALQPLTTTLANSRLAAFFDEMWYRVKKAAAREATQTEFKSVLPDINDFIKAVQATLPDVHQDALKMWVQDRFPRDGKKYYEHTKKPNYTYNPQYDDRAFLDYPFIKRMTEDDSFADINEGMGKINMGDLDIDLGGADGKLESVVLRELGVVLSTEEHNKLFHKARDAKKFAEFLKYVKDNVKQIFHGDDHMWTLRYYLSRRSTIAVNREDRAGNERDNLIVDLKKNNESVTFTGPLDITRNDKKNPKWDRINLLEHITGQKLVWLSGDNVFRKSNGQWNETYGFLTASDLAILTPYFEEKKLVPVITRGEKAKLAFVEWTKEHEVKAANARKYWNNEYGKGNITEKQMDLWLGKDLEDPNDITYEFHAGQIARYEFYQTLYPGLSKQGDGAKMFKRAKIPTGGVLISDEMPDFRQRIFDPDPADGVVSFVSPNGYVQPAMVQVAGHEGKKYIFDGGSPTSNSIFNDFRTYLGLQQGGEHFKTVIYNNDAQDLIANKHEHFQIGPNIEVWKNYGEENAQLLWSTNENADIFDSDGSPVGMYNTDNEAKIFSSTDLTIPGNAVGVIKYGDTHKTGRHPLQVYNYIREEAVKEVFEEHYLPQIHSGIKEILDLLFGTDGKPSWEHIYDLVKRLDGNYPDFSTHTLVEKARLEGGAHPDLTPILNTLVQTKIIEPAIQLSKVKGSILEFTPNLDGTVQEGEMGVPYKNVKDTLIKDYIEATGDKKASIEKVNEWLSKNEYHMFAYRSPIPYKGGAHMMRVKFLHNSNDIVQLHFNDIYGRFEGDNDGDTLHIEWVPKSIVGVYASIQEELTTIDLSKHTDKKLIDIASVIQFRGLVGEMTYGGKATGEIANIQNVYGQLQDTFYGISLSNEDTGLYDMIVLKDPKEKSGINGFEDENVETALRYYLQAALDNAEFLMLQKLEYSRNGLMKALFKTKNGDPITSNQFDALLPLLNEYLEAPRLRNARDSEGSYDTKKSMEKSARIRAFSLARTETYIEAYQKAKEEYAEDEDSVNELADLNGVWFTEGRTVVEMVATSLIEVYDQAKREHPDYFAGIEEHTFIQKTYNRHSAIHTATMKILNHNKQLQDAIFSQAKKDKVDVLAEIKRGEDYEGKDDFENGMGMGIAFFGTKERPGLIGKYAELGPQIWDKSEEGVKFAEKWSTAFKQLSEVAKIAATLKFLERNATSSQFPPYGDDTKVMSMLHPNLMRQYNRLYNSFEKMKTLDVTYGKDGKVKVEKSPGALARAYSEQSTQKVKKGLGSLFKLKKRNCS